MWPEAKEQRRAYRNLIEDRIRQGEAEAYKNEPRMDLS